MGGGRWGLHDEHVGHSCLRYAGTCWLEQERGAGAMSKDTRLVPLALVVCPFCVFGGGGAGGVLHGERVRHSCLRYAGTC